MKKHSAPMPTLSRREALFASALSFGSLPLRSLVTGLPIPFLLGKSEETWAAAGDAKFLILSHQANGDPINANCPGTYGNANNPNDPLHQIDHPNVAELGERAVNFETPTNFMLGDKTVRAAKCWADLPQALLDNSAFWHHATFTNAHTDFGVVMGLNGALKGPDGLGADSLGSCIAYENSEALGTLSRELICIGGSPTKSNGVAASELRPVSLKSLFTAKVAQFDNMVAMRDQFLDKTYRDIKNNGTPAQQKFLSRYAISRVEAQAMGDSLGGLIEDISGDTVADQAKMAAALIQLKVAPVITLGCRFGGDNHDDINLDREVTETLSSLAAIKILWDKLTLAGVDKSVVFASFNVFGRTLVRPEGAGRDHNGSHHAMYVFGPSIKPGMVGGLETYQRRANQIDFKARAINAATGGVASPDIPFEQTLVAVGKTLAKAVGVSDARIAKRFDGGKIIAGALR